MPEIQHWDTYTVIAVSILIMLGFSLWGFRHRVKVAYIILIWLPFLTILFIGYLRITSGEKMNKDLWIKGIVAVVKVFADTTEALGHARITDAGDDYQKILSLHTQWLEEMFYVAHMRTLRRLPGTADKLYRVIDPPPGIDKDGEIDDMEEAGDNYGTPCDEWFEYYQKGFDGEVAVDENIGNRKSAHFITIIVPLQDTRVSDRFGNPYTEAILEVDIRKDMRADVIRLLHFVLLRSYAIVIGLYLIVLFVITFLASNSAKLRRTNAALIAAQQRAEFLAKVKSKFLADMGKEITTPLR
ncbi:hypothetical protein FACS189419_09110 [Planctomycetales bacterium]|nr:hypothetical protein FACS189419_09110 [Planctomycetales bacterium]